MERLGPFSGDPGGMSLRLSSRPFRDASCLHGPKDPQVLSFLREALAASAWQVSKAVGVSPDTVRRLWGSGFLIRLETGKTPPLYALSPSFSGRAFEWDVLTAIKLAASCQLWLCLRKAWPGSRYVPLPNPVYTALVSWRGTDFWVVCPRIFPGQVDSSRDDIEAAPPESRVVVVAGSRELAEEVCRVSEPPVPVRFVWDRILVPGETVTLYAPGPRKTLLESEKILPGGIDAGGVSV